MKPNLLATKLRVPSLPARQVPRPHLTQRLDEGLAAGRRLTLVSAPAGFGKTTCVSEWVGRLTTPVAWLSLDPSDDDPGRFFAYLVAALQKVDGKAGQEIEGPLQSVQLPPLEPLLTSLLNDIAKMPRFLLVLDDFQVIREGAILKAMERLLANQPPNMHLVLVTREDPQLPLARLRANNQLTEVRAAELRFSVLEADQFLQEVLGLSLDQADIAVLAERTEGWIVGLQLAGLSVRDRTDASQLIAGLSGTHRFILSYLTEQVLGQQPEETASFLLQTSILDRLSGELCDAVTARSGSAALLERLFSANLFLVALDDEQRWYRYHHLFADLLGSRLRQSLSAEAIRELHRRASECLAQHDLLDEAIEHALAGEDGERAASLVEQGAHGLMMGGRVKTLQDWLAALPEAVSQSHPRLRIYRMWIDLMQGKLDISDRAMQEREALLDSLPPSPESDQLRLEFVVMLCRFVAITGSTSRAIRLASDAKARLPESDLASRARVHSALAIAYDLEGNADQAAPAYRECFRLAEAAGYYTLAAHTLMMMAQWRTNYGQLREAARLSQSIIDMGAQAGQKTFHPAGQGHIGLAAIHLEWNELEAAEDHLHQGMALCTQGGLAGASTASAIRARLLQARGDLAGALAESLAAQAYYGGVDPAGLARQILIRLAMGDVGEAARVAAPWMRLLRGEPGVPRLPLLAVEDVQTSVARVLLAQGEIESALQVLDELQATAEPGRRRGRLVEALLLRALALQAQSGGDLTPAALACFERALELAEPEGYVLLFAEGGPPVARLLEAVAHRAEVPGRLRQYAHRLLGAFPGGVRTVKAPAGAGKLIEPLSGRELEVLQLICEGCSNREIAERLVVTVSAVKKHTGNIFGKLGVSSRTQAIARARRLGLVSVDG